MGSGSNSIGKAMPSRRTTRVAHPVERKQQEACEESWAVTGYAATNNNDHLAPAQSGSRSWLLGVRRRGSSGGGEEHRSQIGRSGDDEKRQSDGHHWLA